jgi:GMP synthase (glutamine-hydrolysing)
VFLSVKSVGVTGDGRRPDPAIALRAVETIDSMTAHRVRLLNELLLAWCLPRILNEIKGFSRVVCEISRKLLATIEWEQEIRSMVHLRLISA